MRAMRIFFGSSFAAASAVALESQIRTTNLSFQWLATATCDINRIAMSHRGVHYLFSNKLFLREKET
jgi:hypothetical protein